MWINVGAELVKASTLLSVIGVGELLLRTQEIVGRNFMTLEFYLVAGALYFAICLAIERLGKYVGAANRRDGRGLRSKARSSFPRRSPSVQTGASGIVFAPSLVRANGIGIDSARNLSLSSAFPLDGANRHEML